ncbi:MAG TPA: TolC family protein [Burkholderiaceae bacterium]|nr:TolC family protein [Burkholderiaceae bacterium]
MNEISRLNRTNRFPLTLAICAALASLPGRAVAQSPALPAGPPPTETAEAPAPFVDLDQVIERVLRDNPTLRALRQDEDAARALERQAALRPNPVLSYDDQRGPSGNRAYAASISIPLEIAGQRAARMDAAQASTRAVGSDVGQRSAELRAAAIQAFFDLVGAQDRLELARGSRELAQRATSVAGRRVAAGRASPVEEARARVAEATARIENSQANVNLETARIRLAALWGGGEPRVFNARTPTARLPAEPAADELFRRLEAAPALVRARAEIERRESLLRLARAQAAPATALNVGTGTLIENGQRANLVGVSIAIPLFDRNQGNIAEATIRAQQARQELAAAERMLRAELDQALTRLKAAREEARLADQEILPEASRTLDAATRGYELGKFGFLDVLDAQRTLFAARGQWLRALADSYKAAAEVERLLGPPTVAGGSTVPVALSTTATSATPMRPGASRSTDLLPTASPSANRHPLISDMPTPPPAPSRFRP